MDDKQQDKLETTDNVSRQVDTQVRLIYLPVNEKTGEIDYEYIVCDVQKANLHLPENDIIDGWEFKPFKIIPA